jgi:nitrile hydratase subunit beta
LITEGLLIMEDATIPEDRPRAMHDIGGISRFMCESVDPSPHVLTGFDKEVDAIVGVLRRKQLTSVDELRRGIEAIPESDYHRLTYYQRWLVSVTGSLLEKGVFSEAELSAALARP